jgi:hypothetical protein
MTFVVAAVSVGSALIGASASRRAARSQAAAAEQSAELQREMFERQVELQEPWRAAGVEALNRLMPLMRYQRFGMNQFRQDPGYAFRLAEGQKALERSAAARGGLLSGGTLAATQRYGQDMASQEYTNAFNRYQTERAARLNPLQSLAGLGQTSANTLSAAAGQYGVNAGNAMQSAAAARASGYVGGANAITGALGQYMNYSQNQDYLNVLRANQVGMTYTPGQGYTYGANLPNVGPQLPPGP